MCTDGHVRREWMYVFFSFLLRIWQTIEMGVEEVISRLEVMAWHFVVALRK